MQFILPLIIAFAALTSAVNIRGYINYGCKGPQWICTNMPSGVCCNFPTNIRSINWALPSKAYILPIHPPPIPVLMRGLAKFHEVKASRMLASAVPVSSSPAPARVPHRYGTVSTLLQL